MKSTETSLSSHQRRVLFSTCLGHCLTHLYMLSFPALVMPLRRDLGMSLGDALQLSFFGYLVYGLGGLPAGMLADRFRSSSMLVWCLGLGGLGALAAGFSQTPLQLSLALTLLGLGTSIYHPTGMAMISRSFRAKRGRALGLNGVFGNIGLACAPFVSGLASARFGWRNAYFLLAVPGLLGAVVVAWLAREVPAANPSDTKAPVAPPTVSRSHVRVFAALCVAMTLGGFAYRSTSVVMPAYFELKVGFQAAWISEWLGDGAARTATATALTSLVYAIGIFGQLIGGRVADRYDLRIAYICFHAATIPALIAMAFLGHWGLLAAAMLYILFSLGMQPIENSLVAQLSPEKWRSTAYGLKFILTFGVGALAVPAAALIEKNGSLSQVFVVVTAVEIVLVFVAFVVWRWSRVALLRLGND
jgi:MFS family permease